MAKATLMKEEKIIDYIDEEINDNYSDDDLYNISSWGADLSFRELVQRYKDGDLLKPEMQRNYVWDKVEASRFIDSILLGLPVPSIFLAKTRDEKMLIVDGYQRIMTIFDYVETGIFRTDGKVFKLTNSEKINARWRGKAFNELSDTEQRKIKNTTIHSIIFVQLQPVENDTSLYQVFERINTSGRTLIPQEIRNCVYQGKFNSLLIDLNKNLKWRTLYGLEKPDSRMRDIEFILRFFALESKTWSRESTKSISLKKFLNEYMGNAETNNSLFLSEKKANFTETIDFIHDYLGPEAFQNLSPRDPHKATGKFNPTIFDSLAISTLIAQQSGHKIDTRNLKSKRIALLKDDAFQDLIRVRTTNEDRIAARISQTLYHFFGLSYE